MMDQRTYLRSRPTAPKDIDYRFEKTVTTALSGHSEVIRCSPNNQPPICARKTKAQHGNHRSTHAYQQDGLSPNAIRQSVPRKYSDCHYRKVQGHLARQYQSANSEHLPRKHTTIPAAHNQSNVIPHFLGVSLDDVQLSNHLEKHT